LRASTSQRRSPRRRCYHPLRLVLPALRIGPPLRATLVHPRTVGRATNLRGGHTILPQREAGRDCRDAFLGLAKTCAKRRQLLRISRPPPARGWRLVGARPARPRQAPRHNLIAQGFAPVTRISHKA
jgi:hypothetical protein